LPTEVKGKGCYILTAVQVGCSSPFPCPWACWWLCHWSV